MKRSDKLRKGTIEDLCAPAAGMMVETADLQGYLIFQHNEWQRVEKKDLPKDFFNRGLAAFERENSDETL